MHAWSVSQCQITDITLVTETFLSKSSRESCNVGKMLISSGEVGVPTPKLYGWI